MFNLAQFVQQIRESSPAVAERIADEAFGRIDLAAQKQEMQPAQVASARRAVFAAFAAKENALRDRRTPIY